MFNPIRTKSKIDKEVNPTCFDNGVKESSIFLPLYSYSTRIIPISWMGLVDFM